MTKDSSKFIYLKYEDGTMVTFRNNNESRAISKDTIGKIGTKIENVLLFQGLIHNLLSISQLCDKGYHVNFEKDVYGLRQIR